MSTECRETAIVEHFTGQSQRAGPYFWKGGVYFDIGPPRAGMIAVVLKIKLSEIPAIPRSTWGEAIDWYSST